MSSIQAQKFSLPDARTQGYCTCRMEIDPLAMAHEVEKLENGKWVHTGQHGGGPDERNSPLPKEVTERVARGEEGEFKVGGETYRIRRAAKP